MYAYSIPIFLSRQCHSFSACVDARYDMKEGITDIQRTMQ